MASTSADFLDWLAPKFLGYPSSLAEHLYVNQIPPHYRAPDLSFGFPKRVVPTRKSPTGHSLPGVTDAILLNSRNGEVVPGWQEAFARPGLQAETWECRDNLVVRGIVETQSELGAACGELRWRRILSSRELPDAPTHSPDRRFRVSERSSPRWRTRYQAVDVFREPVDDQFLDPGGWGVRVELPDVGGEPLPVVSSADYSPIFGDPFEPAVSWNGNGGAESW